MPALDSLFDHYSLNARLRPGLLVLLPLAFGVAAWSSATLEAFVTGTLASLFGVCGATMPLAELVRDRGQALQDVLWVKWGGKPTTQLLRHRRRESNPLQLRRYHERLAKLSGHAMPTSQKESTQPTQADQAYDDAVSVLIARTRSKDLFPLVYKENVIYGFRRNLLGMRAPGIFTSLLGTLASVAAATWLHSQGGTIHVALFCAFASALLLTWWLLRINSNWVKRQGFAYAARLLECLERSEITNQ